MAHKRRSWVSGAIIVGVALSFGVGSVWAWRVLSRPSIVRTVMVTNAVADGVSVRAACRVSDGTATEWGAADAMVRVGPGKSAEVLRQGAEYAGEFEGMRLACRAVDERGRTVTRTFSADEVEWVWDRGLVAREGELRIGPPRAGTAPVAVKAGVLVNEWKPPRVDVITALLASEKFIAELPTMQVRRAGAEERAAPVEFEVPRGVSCAGEFAVYVLVTPALSDEDCLSLVVENAAGEEVWAVPGGGGG